jgi:hypothetical protein
MGVGWEASGACPATAGQALSGPHCVIVTNVSSDVALKRMDEDARRRAELELAEKIHQLRIEGVSYDRIAKRMRMDWYSITGMHRRHLDRLRHLEELGATEVSRRLQEERYESLLSTVWGRAMTGDLNAVREARMILDSISARSERVTAMFTKTTDDSSLTLVAKGSTEEYIEALKRLSE